MLDLDNFENYKEKVLSGIASRNQLIESLYKSEELRSKLGSFLLKNKGTKDDVNDLLTNAIIAFIKQCFRPEFEVSKSVQAYILTTAKNEWINNQKSLRKKEELYERYVADSSVIGSSEDSDADKMIVLRDAIAKIDEKCRKILTLWAMNTKMREIALKMDYDSEGFVRKKKFVCLKRLKDIIMKI